LASCKMMEFNRMAWLGMVSPSPFSSAGALPPDNPLII
jgi:hypothetical protein